MISTVPTTELNPGDEISSHEQVLGFRGRTWRSFYVGILPITISFEFFPYIHNIYKGIMWITDTIKTCFFSSHHSPIGTFSPPKGMSKTKLSQAHCGTRSPTSTPTKFPSSLALVLGPLFTSLQRYLRLRHS